METFKFFLLSTLLVSGSPWVLKSSHTNVIPNLTDDINLRCFCKNPYDAKPAIEQITRIRLLKWDDTATWITYAEVVVPDNSRVELAKPRVPGIRAFGQLGELNQSFLSVTWSTASYDTLGTYKCEVDGFAAHQGTNTQINTAVVNITNNDVTVEDLLNVAIQMKRKANNITKELEGIKEEHDLQHRELTEKMMREINSGVKNNYFEARYWPTEKYALLAPKTGCPDTSFRQLTLGSATLQSESSKVPQHNFSSPNHLGKGVFERCGTRNILKLHFCTNGKEEPRILWPQGSYCIHRSSSCPTNFVYGYETLHSESSSNLLLTIENIADPLTHTSEAKKWYLLFCCREDGNASTPIVLPSEKPFYLYRYKGKCQSVYNMDVTNEWLQVDTDVTKTNTFSNQYHADGDIKAGRVEMCYYTRKKRHT